jgi:hypothetical protein
METAGDRLLRAASGSSKTHRKYKAYRERYGDSRVKLPTEIATVLGKCASKLNLEDTLSVQTESCKL